MYISWENRKTGLILRQKVFDLIFRAHHNELEQVNTMLQYFLDDRSPDELEEKYGDSRRKPQNLPTLAVSDLSMRPRSESSE